MCYDTYTGIIPGKGANMILWILSTLLVGVAAGYLANRIMGRSTSDMTANLVLGIAGSIVGSLAAGLLGLGSRNIIGSLIIAVVGACLALWLFDRFLRK